LLKAIVIGRFEGLVRPIENHYRQINIVANAAAAFQSASTGDLGVDKQ